MESHKYTFHLVALPHTQVNKDFSACAFNEKVRKFAIMLKMLGHKVYVYAGDKTDVVCDEAIVCITEAERVACLNGKHYTEASFDYNLPHWRKFNGKVIEGIKKRADKKDFICIIGGLAHKEIADAFPEMMTVEFGIGYAGSFAQYRVFESYAWMHTTYGHQFGPPERVDGRFYDAVIPSYFEIKDFPYETQKDDYFLYIGRLTDRKGWRIAQDVCEELGERLIVAGPGKFDGYGEYVGVVDSVKRGQLMSKAKAVFVPTLYIGPFESVNVEAMLCGTPVITTDWGVFPETNLHGITGYRCKTMEQFIWATENIDKIKPENCRSWGLNYSLEKVSKMYQQYFDQLYGLWDKGFYNEEPINNLDWLKKDYGITTAFN